MKHIKRSDRRKSLAKSRVSKKELQRLFHVPIEVETMRIAIEGHPLAKKLAATADRIAKRGGLVDVFKRSSDYRGSGLTQLIAWRSGGKPPHLFDISLYVPYFHCETYRALIETQTRMGRSRLSSVVI